MTIGRIIVINEINRKLIKGFRDIYPSCISTMRCPRRSAMGIFHMIHEKLWLKKITSAKLSFKRGLRCKPEIIGVKISYLFCISSFGSSGNIFANSSFATFFKKIYTRFPAQFDKIFAKLFCVFYFMLSFEKG